MFFVNTDAEEPVGGTRRSRCILRLTSDGGFVQEHPVAESAGDEHAAAGEPIRPIRTACIDLFLTLMVCCCQPSHRAGELAAERGHDRGWHEFEQRLVVGQRRDLFEER